MQGCTNAVGAGGAGTMTMIQRFGSASNFNIHDHMHFLDGVYRKTASMPSSISVKAFTGA
ncbi:MAG: transposase [Pseudomonadales bacterium]|nr:transposase [Pseudomonadales bacterium]